MLTENRVLEIAKKHVASEGLNPLGWARAKLYRNTTFRHLQLIVYSLICEIELSSSKLIGPTIFYSAKVRKTIHTATMLDELKNICLCNGPQELHEISIREKITPSNAIKKIIKTFIGATQFKDNSISWLEAITLSACNQKGIFDTKKLSQVIRGETKYPILTFCDAIGVENLVAQIAKAHGIKTITLQHGQYRVLNDKSYSADAEAYLNFVSDKMLCWGQATITELSKAGITRDRLISCGRLTPTTKYKNFHTAPHNIFGVILCGENQIQSNITLLQFAEKLSKETGMRYIVKLHPANPITRYEKLKGKSCVKISKIHNSEYFASCSFSIMAMSGFFIDCIEAKHRFIFFDDGGLSDVFKASGLSATRTNEIPSLLESISNSSFDFLTEKYNDKNLQSERVIEAIYGSLGNQI